MGIVQARSTLKSLYVSMRFAPQQPFRRGAVFASVPVVFLGILVPVFAYADVKISSSATSNMTCSNGICTPTAKNAVLNVDDLENLLASGNVDVTTTGSGVQAINILVDAPLTWSSPNGLGLDANETILIEKPVTVTGEGGLSITTNDGGENGYLGFGTRGNVAFANLSNTLTINGAVYILEGDIKSLAEAIRANSSGNFALANNYDASKDKTYRNSPITTQFSGSFEGLGHAITGLSLKGEGSDTPVGLFSELAQHNQPGGAIENITLLNVDVSGTGLEVGGLVGVNLGSISNAFVNGTLTSSFHRGGPEIGGLVGRNSGQISRSAVTGTVGNGRSETIAGCLVASNDGTISQSYVDCVVSGGKSGALGGLIGSNGGPVELSYAMGSITSPKGTPVGGLIGSNGGSNATVAQSYSTTELSDVNGRGNRDDGGLIGVDGTGSNSSDYWDLSTSHITNPNEGAGTPKNDPGITGLTTEQFQAGLPSGFDPTVWAEDPKINGGLPYLINNPPRKD